MANLHDNLKIWEWLSSKIHHGRYMTKTIQSTKVTQPLVKNKLRTHTSQLKGSLRPFPLAHTCLQPNKIDKLDDVQNKY